MKWKALAFLVGGLALLLSGCVAPRSMGDQAMDAGDYALALEHYEVAIAEGSRDPEVFYNAARASQRVGAFRAAERYFSQSLRYGGGPEVARSLAQFYVQTSNYMAAVRVFQYLVRIEEDPQPMYSNIGTALMYQGEYLDAETYLLMAQELRPTDPVPYINLGVLYDRHIRNPPRAVSFYQCFLELAPGESSEARVVSNRLREIRTERPGLDASRVGLICGEVFRIPEAERVDLHQIFELDFPDDEDGDGSVVLESLTPRGQGGQERGGESRAADDAGESDREAVRASARVALEAGHYDRVVERMEAIDGELWTREDRQMVGEALESMGRHREALEQWELVLEERPRPEVAQRLLRLYDRVDDDGGRARICSRFGTWPDYEEALASCRQ